MTTAIGYIRVSLEKQAQKGMSLEAQRAKIEGYCKLYEIELIGIEVDPGISAKDLCRPALQRALGRLEDGEADTLIVVDLDRLTRSVRDLYNLLERYFSDRFTLLSVSEKLDTNSASGRLVLGILGIVAQWQREVISENASNSLGYLRDNGCYTGGKARYGYSISSDGVHLEPNPEEQHVIDLARKFAATGMSLRETARIINERGHRTRKGGKFQAAQIKKMLAA